METKIKNLINKIEEQRTAIAKEHAEFKAKMETKLEEEKTVLKDIWQYRHNGKVYKNRVALTLTIIRYYQIWSK